MNSFKTLSYCITCLCSMIVISAMEEEKEKKIIFIHGIATPNLLDPIKGLFSQPKQFKKEDIGRIRDLSGNFCRYKIIKNNEHYDMTNFCWYSSDYEREGILSKTGRYEAAQALFTFLSEDNELQNKEISIIAHSHGGNVATELLFG